MFTTTNTDQFASNTCTAQPMSGKLTAAVSKTFQSHVMTLPDEKERSETLQKMLNFIKVHFPGEMSDFSRTSLDKRRMTPAENSSESMDVSIRPMRKLLDKYECSDLPEHLNSLVDSFNAELKRIKNIEENTEIIPSLKKRDMKRFSEAIVDFGRYIYKQSSPLCEADNRGGCTASDCVTAAIKTKSNLESWHNAIKILCEGVFDPLFAELGSPDNNASEKVKAIELLNKMQQIMQTYEREDYFKIDRILNMIEQGVYRVKAQPYLSGLIFEDFFNIGDLIVFQETMQMLFDYYQFTPESALTKVPPKLNDIIKSYASK
ncbi:hypothetical protein J7438_02790 [Thalassotalea sp. G20_0]|uniref:hypothetical protein n=1 Tax=Thalassotalea sp. G20_0 TaxID=2821093 RepID=UPI001ADD00FB|nr:hypothetical protein [Thalassotalea sp. G20_0]MBO9493019.1 hypothetical protein [Thalassotalea sp. G20_0]